MKHRRSVRGVAFNNDETRILSWSGDGTAKLWDVEVDEDFPSKHLPLIVKVATGTSMDDYGNIITLSKKEWEEYKANYILIAENHVKICKHKDANIYLNYQKPNWDEK
jgi:WD40 repeat protein